MDTPTERTPRIPVTVVCGFLGAGKTTLLKRILEAPNGVKFGVLVNDFGAINIDADLIVETGADQVSLANGCICCSIRDDLVDAIEQILQAQPRPDRLIIEASGVSRPLAILDILDRPEFEDRLAVDATLCLVDADQFPSLDYSSTELAIDQAGSSDLLIINKCDIASAADILATEETLLGPMPHVRRIRATYAHVPDEILFGFDASDAALKLHSNQKQQDHHTPQTSHNYHPHHNHEHDDHGSHHHHNHADEFQAWSWNSDRTINLDAFRASIQRLPTGLLRAKGIVRVRSGGSARRAIFHLVGKRSVVTTDDGAPPTSSQVVAIARKGALDSDRLTHLMEACCEL